jgi:UDP-N-acetylmuramoylalanine--D-glutamate ligase
VHLILGGSLKGEDFAPLAEAIGPNVKSVHLVGEAAAGLRRDIGRAHDDGTLRQAVEHAFGEARPGETILLSPACASYDQFESFEHRGDAFRRLVAELRG